MALSDSVTMLTAFGNGRSAWLGLAVLAGGVLIAHSVLVAAGASSAVTTAANLAMVAAALGWARRHRLDARDLGLSRKPALGSLRLGLVASLGIFVLVALVAGALPLDADVAQLAPYDLAFRLLIAIPIGTAVSEEILFRGVLLGAWDKIHADNESSARTRQPARGTWRSTVIVSGLFGLWHVTAEWQRTQSAALVGGVLATAAASALVLCPLRRRTGSVVAPIAVHAATNVAVLTAIYLASR